MRISNAVKLYMNFFDISVRDLAKELGVSRSTVSRFLNGRETNFTNGVKFVEWLLKDDNVTNLKQTK